MSEGPPVAGVIVFVVFIGVWIAAFGYWIVVLVQVSKTPEYPRSHRRPQTQDDPRPDQQGSTHV